jgi:hypothetical protein
MSAKTNDTLFLAIGGFALIGAGAWAFLQQSHIDELGAPPVAPQSGSAYESSPIQISKPETQRWSDAVSQKAGEKWIYDVFTPPKIYYNTQTKQFTVVPPEPPKPMDPTVPVVDPLAPPPFGLELVKVEQPLFRLQLEGYIGEGAKARGNFLNVQTGAVLFGTTGKKIPDLNLEVVKFSAERRVVQQPGGTTLVFTEASATVRDTVTGVETVLNANTRVPEGPLTVTFKQLDGTLRTAKTGDVISFGEATYTVGDLVVEPPSAVVTKADPSLPAPEKQTLVIPPPPAPVVDPNAAPVESGAGSAAPAAFPGF